ncbi:MAG: M28 family peptidase [Bacteroidota bacterium]
MKYTATIFFSFFLLNITFAQDTKIPAADLEKSFVEGHMRFLASDELQGRRTGEPGNRIAARYLAAQLEAYGVKQVEGAKGYMQPVGLRQTKPITKATLAWQEHIYNQKTELMMLAGSAEDLEAEVTFVSYGWIDEEAGRNDYKGKDVKGKIVVTNIGTPDNNQPMAVIQSMSKKRKWAKEQGAIGMIELFQLGRNYWNMVGNYFARPRIQLVDPEEQGNDFIYGWILEGDTGFGVAAKEKKKQKVKLNMMASNSEMLNSSNVIGVIEGSDEKLKEEYVILTAHYDHVGTGKNGGGAFTEKDSIFNGARDNAFGTVALLSAAKTLAANPTKRSVIILAVTGEELGLLGSRYYSENPLIPLEKTIYNFNTDGAGYNTKDRVSIIGLGRTGVDGELEKAASAFGLKVGGDPAPEQGLFDRSDNVSFASKGVPALNFAPGMTVFDAAIMKYYHQVADNPETIDFDYLLKYCQSFTHAAQLIANRAERPFWVADDKYEEVGKKLYNKE